MLSREIISPSINLFQFNNQSNPTYQPSPSSHINPKHLEYFRFIGTIFAKAICDGELLNIHFTPSFYKHILGLPITFKDFESYDIEYYNSLNSILNQSIDDLGLDLTFSTEAHMFGASSVVDLIENGSKISVTDKNSKPIHRFCLFNFSLKTN